MIRINGRASSCDIWVLMKILGINAKFMIVHIMKSMKLTRIYIYTINSPPSDMDRKGINESCTD